MTFVLSISAIFLEIAFLVSKIQSSATYFIVACHAVIGLIQSAALIMITIQIFHMEHAQKIVKIMSLISIGSLVLLNILGFIIQTPILFADKHLRKWLKTQKKKQCSYNMLWFSLTSIIGLLVNYKIKMLLFSRLFGFGCFKCKLQSVQKFKIFNFLSFFGLFPQIVGLYCSFSVLLKSNSGDTIFLIMIDSIIVLLLNILFSVLVVPKHNTFFQEQVDGIRCGRVVNIPEESVTSIVIQSQIWRQNKQICLSDITEMDQDLHVTTKRKRNGKIKQQIPEVKQESQQDNTQMTGSLIAPQEIRQNPSQNEQIQENRSDQRKEQQQNKKQENILMIDAEYLSNQQQNDNIEPEEILDNKQIESARIKCPSALSNPPLQKIQQPITPNIIIAENSNDNDKNKGKSGSNQTINDLADYLIKAQRQKIQQLELSKPIEIEQIQQQLYQYEGESKIPIIKLQVQQEQHQRYNTQKIVKQQIYFAIQDKQIHLTEQRQSLFSNYHQVTQLLQADQSQPLPDQSHFLKQKQQQEQQKRLKEKQEKEAKLYISTTVNQKAKNNKRLIKQYQSKAQTGNIRVNTSSGIQISDQGHQQTPLKNKSSERIKNHQNYPISTSPKKPQSRSESSQEIVQSPRTQLRTQGQKRTKKQELLLLLKTKKTESEESEPEKQFKRTNFRSQQTLLVPTLFKHQSTQETNTLQDQPPLKPAMSHQLSPNKPKVYAPRQNKSKPKQTVAESHDNRANVFTRNNYRKQKQPVNQSKQSQSNTLTRNHYVFSKDFKTTMKQMTLTADRSKSLSHFRDNSISKQGMSHENRRKMLSLQKIYLQRLNK